MNQDEDEKGRPATEPPLILSPQTRRANKSNRECSSPKSLDLPFEQPVRLWPCSSRSTAARHQHRSGLGGGYAAAQINRVMS